MMDSPTNLLTELAKERNRAAAERTIMAWVRRCLLLMTLGISLDRIFVALNQRFPTSSLASQTQLAHILGLVFIGFSLVLMSLAIAQYVLLVQAIEQRRR